MSKVTFNTSIGGDGSSVSDDNDAATGLGNGGHRTRFVPALQQTVNIVSTAVTKADEARQDAESAAASAAAALEITSLDPANYPASRPILNLDFANAKKLHPFVEFSRSTTATRTNAKGDLESVPINQARLDYDALTGACKGLLIEPQRTNLLTYSEQLDNAAWSTVEGVSVTSNTTVAPDGTTTADSLKEDATSLQKALRRPNVLSLTSSSYTFSAYIKRLDTGLARSVYLSSVSFDDSSAGITRFDLTNGVVTYNDTNRVGGIQKLKNGWFRVWQHIDSADTNDSNILKIGTTDELGTTILHAGDTDSGLFVWGAQLEAGDYPTSYIPTVASTVTRNAEAARISGDLFNSFYTEGVGTVIADFHAATSSDVRFLWSLSDQSSNNRIDCRLDSSDSVKFFCADASLNQFDLGTQLNDGNVKAVAAAFEANSSAVSLAGQTAEAIASGTIPSGLTQLAIGGNYLASPGQALGGHIAHLMLYTARLTNSQAEAMSQ